MFDIFGARGGDIERGKCAEKMPQNKLMKVVDHVYEFRVLGGDPFINKELHKYVNRLVEYQNVENVVIYTNEEECQVAKYELIETYNNKPEQYKLITQIDSYCVEFESFPIKVLSKINETNLGV